MKTTTNPGTALKKLNDDFSNIEEVYTEMRNEWQELNPEGTEIDFLDSFDFSNGHDVDTIDETQFKPAELVNLSKLSNHLGRKRSHVKRLSIDHYNLYLRSKEWGNRTYGSFNQGYKKHEYKKAIDELEEMKEIYTFIFDRLDEDGRIELKDDFLDKLQRIHDEQDYRKFKTIISNLIAEIEAASQEKGTSSPQKKRPGKPSVPVKPAQDYLQNIDFEERKILFLKELKKAYKDCEPKTFNHLIKVLSEMGYLNMTSKVEIKESFELAIKPKSQSQTNFNNWMNKPHDPDLKKSIESRIRTIMKENQVV